MSSKATTVEQILSGIYKTDGYWKTEIVTPKRFGTAATLVTNETLPDDLKLIPYPNGYIIGVGNGSIWSMLSLFRSGTLPKAVISIEHDAGVALSGIVLTELAKRGISRYEALSYLFGLPESLKKDEKLPIPDYSVDDTLRIARDLVESEQNSRFKQKLIEALNDKNFVEDLTLIRYLERKGNPPDIRRRKSIAATIDKYWDSIVTLAQDGKIFFIHSDAANEYTLDYLDFNIPDIKLARNILYTSNVVDTRYRRELNGWERFNAFGESWYVFTTQFVDDYILRASHRSPSLPIRSN